VLADALGRPLRFILTGGEAGDVTMAPALLNDAQAGGVIADKAYDSNELRALIAEAGAEAVIPSNRTRKILIPHDVAAYKLRNRIERFFNKLKHFRHIATRYDRRAVHFLACLYLASAMIWMR
jgi:transposase